MATDVPTTSNRHCFNCTHNPLTDSEIAQARLTDKINFSCNKMTSDQIDTIEYALKWCMHFEQRG